MGFGVFRPASLLHPLPPALEFGLCFLGVAEVMMRHGEEGDVGTRDQLFLSLRFAGIAQHLKKHGPMPLIVDEVLVNFDNERSLATSRSLFDLSNETQVLFFTHYQHLLEMAQEHLPKDKVFVHDL